MTTRRHGIPSELFALIPDDEPVSEARERTAEEEAVHVVRVTRRRADDPGRADVDRAPGARGAAGRRRGGRRDGDTVAPHYRYDDEEPELDDPDRWDPEDDDETQDCEELLVIQHYAFDDSGGDDDSTDD